MDQIREKLRSFYAESLAKSLKVRRTSANRILSMVQGDESVVIAKFNAEVDPGIADVLVTQCMDKVLDLMVDREMGRLDGSVPPAPVDVMPELDI